MNHISTWRTFRRIQDLTVVVASLIYAGAVVHAFAQLPGDPETLARYTLLWPAGFLAACLFLPLAVGPIRRPLTRYVWASYQAGFGQSVGSILGGILLLGGAAAFIYWQIAGVATGGRQPAGVFSGYAAGIGILAAQAALVRVLERHPEVRAQIEVQD